jgi:tRNA A37 threonylcarbamoyladenosine dehydratase
MVTYFVLVPYSCKIKNKIMNELIEKIVKEANISPEQATKSIEAMSSYVKEKFPMLAGAVDNLFGKNEA